MFRPYLRNTFALVALSTAVLGAPTALADEAPLSTIAVDAAATAPAPPPPSPWSGDLGLGFVNTTGNSNSRSITGKLAINYAGRLWGNQFSAAALNGKKDGLTTDERYSLGDKVTYNLTPRDYLFGNGSYDNDRFAAITERYVLTAGYGRHVFATPTQTLDLEGGAGLNGTRERGSEDFSYRPVLTAGGKYVWAISPNAKFTQTLRTEYASNNTFINPVSELKLNIIGALAAAFDYEIRYNTEAPAGTHHTDTITTISIVYSFNEKKS